MFLPDWTACRHICHFAENPMPDSLRPLLHVCVRIYIRDTTPLCSKAPCPAARIACVCVSVCVHTSSLKTLVSAVLAFTVKRDLPDTLSCVPALKQSKQLLHSCLTEWGKAQDSLFLFTNVYYDYHRSIVHICV